MDSNSAHAYTTCHKGNCTEPLSFVCHNCNEVVCRTCSRANHKDHKREPNNHFVRRLAKEQDITKHGQQLEQFIGILLHNIRTYSEEEIKQASEKARGFNPKAAAKKDAKESDIQTPEQLASTVSDYYHYFNEEVGGVINFFQKNDKLNNSEEYLQNFSRLGDYSMISGGVDDLFKCIMDQEAVAAVSLLTNLVGRMYQRKEETIGRNNLYYMNGGNIVTYSLNTLQDIGKPQKTGFASGCRILVTKNQRVFLTGDVDGEFKAQWGNTAVAEYVPDKQACVRTQKMNNEQKNQALVELKEGFLVAMGEKADSSCELYNIENNTWTTLTPLKEERKGFVMYAHEGRSLYVFGGYTTPVHNTSQFSKMDLDSNYKGVWTQGKFELPNAIINVSIFLSTFQIGKDEVLVLGDRQEFSFKYNTRTGKATPEFHKSRYPAMNQPYGAPVMHRGRYYMFTSAGDLEMYDGTQWKHIQSFTTLTK